MAVKTGETFGVNVRLNEGDTDFLILKADADIEPEGELDLQAVPAT